MSIETQSKISLISKALVLCGESPLNSLSDNRYGAQVGSNLFELLYESELQSNRWRFSIKKTALSRLTDVPLNEWQYAYQMPTDCLLPIGVYPRAQYEIYGTHLYTNQASVEMDYQYKPAVSAMPAYFSLLMTYALARDFVKPITESDTAVQIMAAKYNTQRNRALFADSQARPNKPIGDSPFTGVR